MVNASSVCVMLLPNVTFVFGGRDPASTASMGYLVGPASMIFVPGGNRHCIARSLTMPIGDHSPSFASNYSRPFEEFDDFFPGSSFMDWARSEARTVARRRVIASSVDFPPSGHRG